MEESAKRISDHLRPNGERLDLVELDPILGGARLRTTRTDIRNHRYFQINIDSVGQVDLQRIQTDPQSGHRAGTHFDLSREALGRLAEDLLDACQAADEP